MDDTEWPAPLRPIDFYREHQAMQQARSIHTSEGLLRHLRELHGRDEANTLAKLKPEAMALAGSRARRMLRESELLLIKFDVLEAAENALRHFAQPDDMFNFAPLPENTVYGFELPMEFRLSRSGHKVPCRRCRQRGRCPGTLFTLMSVVAPCNFNTLLAGSNEDMPVFIGYSRLVDQIVGFKIDTGGGRGDGRVLEQLREFERQQAWWQVCAWQPMDEPLGNDRISMRLLLQAALALGSQPQPRAADRAPSGTSGGHSAPQVQTVELARRLRKPVRHPGTGTPLQYRSTTKAHDRHYRDAEGNIIKTVRIEGYTRAGDKPERPPEARRGTVRVARLPRPPAADE